MTEDKAEDAIDQDEMEDWDDEELTPAQLTALRAELIRKRTEVIVEIERHVTAVTDDSDNLPDEMDIATRQSEQAMYLRMVDKKKKLLNQIDHALRKFERGEYGICEGTGEPIHHQRLKLRPWTRHSLD
ncbi:MAG: DnaK suppressor protein, partial [Bradymonadia bacterium]